MPQLHPQPNEPGDDIGAELATVEKELEILRREGAALQDPPNATANSPKPSKGAIWQPQSVQSMQPSRPVMNAPPQQQSYSTSTIQSLAKQGPQLYNSPAYSTGASSLLKSAFANARGGFDTYGFSEPVLNAIYSMGWKGPTEIQQKVFADALLGRDILAVAGHSSGKTMSYILLMLHRVNWMLNAVQGIIIVSSADTAWKVDALLKKFAVVLPGLNVLVSTPQTSLAQDREAVTQRPPHILLTTTVRAVELVQDHTLKIASGVMIAVDEAERQFGAQSISLLLFFVGGIQIQRQVLLFSSCLPITLREISAQLQVNPAEAIVVEERDPKNSPAAYASKAAAIAAQEASRVVIEAARVANSARLLEEKIRTTLKPETARQLEAMEAKEASGAGGTAAAGGGGAS